MRPPNPLKGEYISGRRVFAAITTILLFHLVGLIGLCVPSLQVLFLSFVPWHILLMLVVILSVHHRFDGPLILFLLTIFFLSFLAEWLGVHKSWLFGNYGYGKTLGIKLLNIPLVIGVNWFLLVYSAGVLMQRSRVKSMIARIICGALVLVLLDVVIEPVAIHFDYWHWQNNIIPYGNYGGWFLASALMLSLFELFKFKKQSVVAPVLLLTQFVFFAVLYFMNC